MVSVSPSLFCVRGLYRMQRPVLKYNFSIATYLDRGSQARVITEAGRGVAEIINVLAHIKSKSSDYLGEL